MDITVSLEKAKELKEYGWPQDNYFLWIVDSSGSGHFGHYTFDHILVIDSVGVAEDGSKIADKFSAPTAEELLRRLPEAVKYPVRNAIEYELLIRPFDDLDERHWEITYAKDIDNVDNTPLHETTGSLSDAAAEMFIWLKQNNLLH